MNNDDKKLVYLLQHAPMDTVLDDFIYDQIKYIGIYESNNSLNPYINISANYDS